MAVHDGDAAPPTIIRRQADNPFRRPVAEALPQTAVPGAVEAKGSLDELAALIEARQREREQRYASSGVANDHSEDNIDRHEPRFDGEQEAAFGERFGWSERDPGDEVLEYLDGRDGQGAKRRLFSPLMRIGALVAVSAGAALLVVSLVGSSDPVVEEEPAATALAATDEALAQDEPRIAAAPASDHGTTGLRPGANVSAAPSPEPVQPAFAGSDIRTILPAPQQISAGARSTQAPAADPTDDATAAATVEPTVETRAPAASWIAPEPMPSEQAGQEPDVAPVEATDLAETQPARASTAVNMRAEPDNGATVVTVIPENAAVDLIGCDIWCEVVYDGQQGWVYRDFIAAAD